MHATATEVFTEAATADFEIAGLVIAVGLVAAGLMLRVLRDRAGATVLGALGYAFAVLVPAVAVVLVWSTKRYGLALVLVATVAAASIACTLLKQIVARERPPQLIQLMLETDPSLTTRQSRPPA